MVKRLQAKGYTNKSQLKVLTIIQKGSLFSLLLEMYRINQLVGMNALGRASIACFNIN
jgi:hypothetical protein